MENNWSLKILYDGACPLCSMEMDFLKRQDKNKHFEFEDISRSDFDPSRYGKTSKELNLYIHALLPDGSIITGMEVFRRAYSAIGLGYLLSATSLPVLKQLSDLCYRIFANNRIRISRLFGKRHSDSCRLPPN